MFATTVEAELLRRQPVVVLPAIFSFVALRCGPPVGCRQDFGRLFAPVDDWDATVFAPRQPAVAGCCFVAVQRGPSERLRRVLCPLPLIPVCNGIGVRA